MDPYPEWDEFLLVVCEYCNIIIRPQAFEKHLAKRHQVYVRNHNHNNQQQPLQQKAQNQVVLLQPLLGQQQQPLQSIQSPKTNGKHAAVDTADTEMHAVADAAPPVATNNTSNSTNAPPLSTANSIGNPACKPKAPSSQANAATNSSASPVRWSQDRRWRITFQVLKNTFL